MDFEPWWLIFVPVLFALGWLAARFDIRQMLRETRSLPDSYFRGLNFLLNEQPDRAIDAFVEVAKLDPETTELHFALGSLFRRRGEMERAIRVHQSLLNRSDLPSAEREHAQHELAQDFLKAGMLDRAESGFEQLKDTRYALPALRSLIRIYESGTIGRAPSRPSRPCTGWWTNPCRRSSITTANRRRPRCRPSRPTWTRPMSRSRPPTMR